QQMLVGDQLTAPALQFQEVDYVTVENHVETALILADLGKALPSERQHGGKQMRTGWAGRPRAAVKLQALVELDVRVEKIVTAGAAVRQVKVTDKQSGRSCAFQLSPFGFH